MWGILWAVGKWLIATTVKVALWAVANPLGAVLTGVALVSGGAWLEDQSWAGASILASLVNFVGGGILYTGIGSWLGGSVLGLGAVGRAGGGWIGWYRWAQEQVFGYAAPLLRF